MALKMLLTGEINLAWAKGQSGNPSGRPKDVGEIKLLARQYTAQALETLVKALKAKAERTRVAAAEALLDRGWGKATQHLEAEINLLDRLNADEQRSLAGVIQAILAGEENAPDGAAAPDRLQ